LRKIRNGRFIISACLCGINCRYDGQVQQNSSIVELLRKNFCIPVCPEQLGGLSTPRNPSCISNGDGFDVLKGKVKIITYEGKDVTKNFLLGAQEVLKIAQLTGCTQAVLKEKSPSCGVKYIYQGEKFVKGCGVTTALLLENGLAVISEEELD